MGRVGRGGGWVAGRRAMQMVRVDRQVGNLDRPVDDRYIGRQMEPLMQHMSKCNKHRST